MGGRQSVRAIVINGDKILAMKRNKFGQEYYTLVGGGIDVAEDAETALRREVREETGLELGAVREVFIEDGGSLYGLQYVYLCEYKGGDPALQSTSEESLISAMGQNIYEPLWLPLSEVPNVPFRSASVAKALLEGVRNGFPETVQTLAWQAESMTK